MTGLKWDLLIRGSRPRPQRCWAS